MEGRRLVRQQKSRPLIDDTEVPRCAKRVLISQKIKLDKVIRYAVARSRTHILLRTVLRAAQYADIPD